MKKNKVDVITMALINNSLASIIDEMDITIVRTTTSPAQRNHYDFLCCLTNAKGELIAEGEEALVHTNIFHPIIDNLVRTLGDSIHAGDMFCINDPFTGASHLNDIFLIYPIFFDGQLVMWTAAGGHVMDVGGRVPGSSTYDSATCYEEGIRIPTGVKVYDRGIRNDTFFTLLAANSRLGEGIVDQLEPFLAACRMGERHSLELIRKYGWETLKICLDELLDYAERRTRADIKALPNGVYEFEDFIDDDGFGSGPIRFHVKITIDDDTITYDFTGTAPQLKRGMSNPLATTRACVYTAFRSLVSLDIPRNSGQLRPIKIIVPEGTAANPVLPAATGARGVSIARIYDTVMGAQTQVAPEKMPACGSGIDNLFIFSSYDKKQDKILVYADLPWGCWGGRPTADGEMLAAPYMNGGIFPIEVSENLYPIRYNQRAFVPDSEGAGKYRGGFALVVDWEALAETTVLLRADRRKTVPYGLHGGQSGSPTVITLNPDTENRDLGKCVLTMKKGDILRAKIAGAGGWGNTLERDVELVMDDVRNELVSLRRAKEVYGVIINQARMEIDTEQTQTLREAMKSSLNKK